MNTGIVVGLIAAAAVAAFFVLKKKKKKEPRPPRASFFLFAEQRPAGFETAKQYAAWVERHNFPKSEGEPTPADVSIDALDAAHKHVMSVMKYEADGGADYTNPVFHSPDDCEGFAVAFRQAAMDRGVPVTCMRICHLQTSDGFWHGVCLVWVKGSGIWSMDQRLAKPWPLNRDTYILKEAGVEAGDVWLYFDKQG